MIDLMIEVERLMFNGSGQMIETEWKTKWLRSNS